MKKLMAVGIAILALQGLGSAGETGRPMQPRDLYSIQRLSDPQVSPDGRLVAFTVAQTNFEQDETDSDVWVVAAAGGAPRKLPGS
jgi:dipeptidyl aminopeptidase/acylaminoacyl peptidase